jgi:hypothetical protein
MVERGGKGRVKNPTSLRHLERVHMAHECNLEFPGEGNVLPSGAPGSDTATAQARSTHAIAVDVRISNYAYWGSPSRRE